MNSGRNTNAEKWLNRFNKVKASLYDRLKTQDEDYNEDLQEKARIEATEIIKRRFQDVARFEITLDEWYEEVQPKKSKFPKGWWFITLRPNPDVKFYEFHRFVVELFKGKTWEDGYYVWEQKGETEEDMGIGFHIHGIIKVKTAREGKEYYINIIENCVKKNKLNDRFGRNCIQLSRIETEKHLQNLEHYTDTHAFNKDDEWKEKCWNFDKKWRESKELPDKIMINQGPSPFFKSVMERET